MKSLPAQTVLRIAIGQGRASLRFRAKRHLIAGLGILSGVALIVAVKCYQAFPPNALLFDTTYSRRLDWYSAASLVLCLFGVCQSMVISVAEQTREIGTIKCLGASNVLVVLSVVIEMVIFGLLASCAGAILGLGIGMAAAQVPLQQKHFEVALLGSALGLGLTLVSAIPPAIAAAKMEAIQSLRTEV